MDLAAAAARTMATVSDPVPSAPRRLADFDLIRRLGAGGMAEVFLAKKRGAESTYKLLVVKRILPQHVSSERFRAMFAEEARLATRLNHPNIVQVYDFQDYNEDGQLLSMEYVDGPDLGKLARGARAVDERLPPYVAAYIAGEVARGLHYAHERRDEGGQPLEIVHRDVSPQNVLLSSDGVVKIADFGIASANVFREEPGTLKGKTAYMSPEQARAEKVDRRSDIFSLGVVLHELLTGRALYRRTEGKELLDQVRAGNVEAPSVFVKDVPSELEAIVMRALSRDRENRFQTAKDFAAAITRVLFEKQVLVDADVVAGLIKRFVQNEPPGDAVQPERSAEKVVRPGAEVKRVAAQSLDEDGAVQYGRARLRDRVGREVRHVAIVSLRLHGLDSLRAELGAQRTARLVDQLRATLGEIAFKRSTAWTWAKTSPEGAHDESARAVVGLMANPSGAAASAAWLAVDVHEAIQGACDGLPVMLQASVGIVRGIAAGQRDEAGHLIQHTLQGAGTRLGDLLAERAPAGQTWVAGGLYRLVRRDFVWTDVPSLRVEPHERLPVNMHTYALRRPLTREEKQQQHALALRDLIGRDAELADLHAAYHQAVGQASGAGSVVSRVIIGEMGIGKTALANTFLSELPPDARVLRVECSPARRELPFSNAGQWLRELTGTRLEQPFEEARALVEHALGEALDGQNKPEIISQMSALATGRLARADDEADVARHRRLLTTGIRRAFLRLAQQAPLVVVLDGIHWADVQSLELVSSLMRRADALPILTVLVTRPDDHVASVIDGIVTIELGGLSNDNQLRLVQEHLGVVDGVAEVCSDLIPRAAGNPFFLLEMVDALLERGAVELVEGPGSQNSLKRIAGAAPAAQRLPSTLEQLIADRLNELPPEEHRLIAWLAVAGGPLLLAELNALLGPEAEEAVARLCARGLCDARADAVDLRHPLTRDVAYLGLDDDERQRMHCGLADRIAEAPVANGLGAAIVARHYARGGNREQAGLFYLEAGLAAWASYQLQLATRYFNRALTVLPESHLGRLNGLQALENIYRIQGRWKERRSHLSEFRRLAGESRDPLWGAMALIRSARFDLDAGRLARGLRLAQKGEAVARGVGSQQLEVEAQSLMAEMLRDLGDMQGALAACDRALETVRRNGAELRLRADVLGARGTLLLRVGRVQEAVDAHAEAIAVCKRSGARRPEARARNSLAFAMFVLGRFEDAIALALEAIRIDLSIGGRFQIARTLSNIGRCYARLGDLERAKSYLGRARDAHERYGDQDGRADTLLASAELFIETGEFDQAEALIGDAAALSAATGSAYDTVHEKILRALLARKRGDSGSAVMHGFDARQVAEAQAYVAFHFYAMAIEATARVDIGEQHTGILLATTAMGAMETIQGSEYGLETRALCCEALATAGSPQATELRYRAGRYAHQLSSLIRDSELRQSFGARPLVAPFLADEAPFALPISPLR
jgi:tetratricopeptide (TPR) repeat protein/tRNA A-37 threonylcarbamoyl transferase component Bud32